MILYRFVCRVPKNTLALIFQMAFIGQIKKFVSVILIIVLLQKIGGGLFLHNYLHTTNKKEHVTHSQIHLGILNSSCNCIDDFYIPFAEPENKLDTSVSDKAQIFNSKYVPPISICLRIFNSLRAPPTSSLS